MHVRLTTPELAYALHAGLARYHRNRHQHRTGLWHQPAGDYTSDLWGACGELVIAKAAGLDWTAALLTSPDRGEPDVGPWHVRTTPRRNGSLLLHPEDRDDEPYVLVVAGRIPTFRIAGWIMGRHGKLDRWWRTDVRHPAYFAPQKALEPFNLAHLAHTSPNLAQRRGSTNLAPRPPY